ncbi:P-type conjugative transfer ATPase TrbB [Caulobacter segnis]|uniref:P-type conjugative transfer ATPase TrbB n=1 Tax=Caulobacter segnis TaxID=88688 RepID=UPI00240ECF97|nr:P-type conjugative transfer ATPase TrbB [Caulobacter segnis]MDG2522898.1 P-type conjugative transfer ATPase TrbB [Caulobacter segnis]
MHQTLVSASAERGAVMLSTALGLEIGRWLEDDQIADILLNPDGRLWLDRLDGGLIDTGRRIEAADAERIIRLVADHVRLKADAAHPRLSAVLPGGGERFEGLLPPLAAAPCFSIRKPAGQVWRLDRYVADGVMGKAAAACLVAAVRERRNILVAGPTASGKTTLANALLAEIEVVNERVVLIEDTPELQCPAPNLVAMRTREGIASLRDLVRSTLRMRPDRIIVGEVRGAEALEMIKAWGTGHPGGIATIHAGDTPGALRRMEQLVQEAVVRVSRDQIADAVDLVVVIEGRGRARRLREIVEVKGLEVDGGYRLVSALAANAIEEVAA